MARKTIWRLAILLALGVALLPFAKQGLTAPPAEEKTAARKVLDANPGLEEQLKKNEVFKEFKDKLQPVEINGKKIFIVEGDTGLDEDELLFYARERAAQREKFKNKPATSGLPTDAPVHPLIGISENGKLVRWKPGSTVTFCVVKSTFPSNDEFNTTVANMKAATADWEKTCNIRFMHVADKDGAPLTALPPPGVTFTVLKQTLSPPGTVAMSFFPNQTKDRRHLWIDPVYFTPNLAFNKVGVIRHELGHVLGFRHEHIRSEAPPTCPHENLSEVFELTNYDPTSVMHYFCGLKGTKELAISDLDRIGAQLAYGAPENTTGLALPANAIHPSTVFKEVDPENKP
jgi:hypothetical protein